MSLCLDVSVSRCLGSSVSRCLCVSMSLCLGSSVSRCLDVSVSRCLGVPVSRCLCVSMSRCLDVGLNIALVDRSQPSVFNKVVFLVFLFQTFPCRRLRNLSPIHSNKTHVNNEKLSFRQVLRNSYEYKHLN